MIPPDFSRFHSGAGEICVGLYRLLSPKAEITLLPALGTHRPMTDLELDAMFPGIPHDAFRVHDWRQGLTTLGEIPGSRLRELSKGRVDYPIRVEVDRLVAEGGFDLILSVGQVVPHEVAGMAGGNKNILVGTSGPDMINKSHFLGAVCDMETLMGRLESPVRRLFDEAEDRFLAHLPIHYLITVRERNAAGAMITTGLFGGRGHEPFQAAARLSRERNVTRVPPLKRVVVYLDPCEFKSTWLGNKAIYRTRMAIADKGELLILAPGLVEFGEAEVNERLIRKYGYRGTPETLRQVAANPELRENLGAAAHLIHGSSEGRFTITYASGGLSRKDIESVGFQSADFKTMMERYQPETRTDGFHTLPDGESFFFISNPAIGLWQREESQPA
jgi:nickel-dependent lactate racemase